MDCCSVNTVQVTPDTSLTILKTAKADNVAAIESN